MTSKVKFISLHIKSQPRISQRTHVFTEFGDSSSVLSKVIAWTRTDGQTNGLRNQLTDGHTQVTAIPLGHIDSGQIANMLQLLCVKFIEKKNVMGAI